MSDESIMPRKVKYLFMEVFTEEGGFAPDNPDGWRCGSDLDKLISAAVDYAEEHGGETYIYECKPIRRVLRGKTRVIKVK